MSKTVFVFSVIAILFVSSSNIPDAEAKDLGIETECIDGNLIVLITDEEGNPIKGVRVGTTDYMTTKHMEEKFYTDENGKVSIESTSNLGYINLSKGGFNEKIIATPCGKVVESLDHLQKQKTDLYIVQHGPIRELTYLDGYQNVNTAIAGDIVNLSDETLMDIVISVKTFKNGESFQDTTSWHPIKRILRAGEASPFALHPSSGFDSYEIWIEHYQLSQIEPSDPMTKTNGLELKKNIHGTYFLTVPCNTDLDEGLILLIVGYGEDNQIIDLDYQTLDLPNEDDCKLYGGKKSLLNYWGLDDYLGDQAKEVSKRKFSEFFIMRNLEGIITYYQGKYWDITSTPAIPKNSFTLYDTYILNHISVYSKYYPDLPLPRHMDLNEIRIVAEEHGKMNWVYENKPVEVFDNEWVNIDSLNSWGISYSNSGQYWEAITWFDTTLEIDPENLIALYNKGLALGAVGRTDEAAIYFDKVVKLESSLQIPDWIRNNADWWAQGLISDDDFVSGIKYLVEQGIIQVS